MTAAETRDPRELAKFAALAAEWWDPDGQFRPLHRLNPTRLRYIRDHVCEHFGRDPAAPAPLAGLTVLDIGAGGGLLAEPLARLGAAVTGLDAVERNVRVAALHAEEAGLAIDYRCATAEDLAQSAARRDIVLNMEVIEHVANPRLFLAASGDLVRPGGLYFAATLNRTAKAFALAIVGAEYVLRWLPRGTHDWHKFVRPTELARDLKACGLEKLDLTGVRYRPWSDEWTLDPRDLDVNYMGCWTRPPGDDPGERQQRSATRDRRGKPGGDD